MAPVKIQTRRRIALVLIFMLVIFIAVIVQLANIQFVQGSDLQQQAEDLRTKSVSVAAKRGTIYDRTGKTLAVSISADSVYASPREVQSAGSVESTALFLSRVLDMDYDNVLEKLNSDKYFVWIQRKTDFELAQEVQNAGLDGISIAAETQRFYPKGMLACHVLGFAGIDNQGLEGIEVALDDVLSGTDGNIVGQFDSYSREIPQAGQTYNAPEDGYDIVLTLDENIQYFAERELDALMAQENPPKRAMILMVNPQTGEILAMAARPGYDPNNYSDYDSSEIRNPLVSDLYEPGSTFKIITAAVALEEQVVTPEDRFYDPGYIMVSGERIKCWRSYRPHGSQSFREVMQNSCNPGFVEVGLRIENKEHNLFNKYIRAFGFGETTGIELNGEAAGIVPADEDTRQINIATMSFGQGIAVTPLQLVMAVSACVNGGILYEPQIVYQVLDKDGNVVQDFAKKEVRRVISEETSATVRDLLESVVSDGTGSRGYIEGYRVGGKTGTSQKAGEGGYLDGKYVASFCGIAPMDDPQVLCLVIIDEPYTGNNTYQGGQVAAPVFKNVMTDTLHYLGVVSQLAEEEQDLVDEEQDLPEVSVPGLKNLTVEAAVKVLELNGLQAQVEGAESDSQAIVTSQTPAELAQVESGSTVIIKTDGQTTQSAGQITVPDLTGKRLTAVAEMLGAMGLQLSAEGTGGTAYEQSPIPGSLVNSGSVVKVRFSDPDATTTTTEEDVEGNFGP